MLENRAAKWLLVSVVLLWSGLAAPAAEAAPPAAVEVPVVEGLEGRASMAGQEELRGVVIEEIPKGSTLEKAGLLVGDVITTWKRLPNPPANPEAAEGAMVSYFDWQDLEVEQAPRGTVLLRGQRGGEPLQLRMEPGVWDAQVRPVLARSLEEIYLAGKAQLASGDLETAVRAWRSLANNAGGEGGDDLKAWIALQTGAAWGREGTWAKAVEAYREALEATENPMVQYAAWEALGEAHERRNEYQNAEEAYSSALEIRQKLNPKSLGGARNLDSLGKVAWERGELISTEEYITRALEIRKQVAPQSLDEAISLNNLGALAAARGDLAQASDYLLRALQIQKLLALHSLALALSLQNLGALSLKRGELDRAYDYYNRALQVQNELAPESLTLARTLSGIGVVMRNRGELERAHDYHHHALQIQERLAPNSPDVANSLNRLGILAQQRGELDLAYHCYRRGLHIYRQLGSRSLQVAYCLNNLGSLEQLRGRPKYARDYYLEALRIKEHLSPQDLSVGTSLNNLGTLARSRRELERAHDYYLQALKITEPLAYQGLEHLISLHGLGAVAQARHEFSHAYDYFARVIDALEHQASKLGGSYDVQAGFRVQRGKYFYDMLALLLSKDRFVEAFHIMERFRAQTFLTMLAERDTTFSADVPEELNRERRRFRVLYDSTLKKLAGLNLRANGEEIEAIRRELQKLDEEAGDIEARIRQASPRLAALQYPKPLRTAEAQRALDEGTLLLGYSVDTKRTALFVLSGSRDLEVKTLPLGEEALRARVKQLLSLLREADRGSSVGELRQHRIEAVSRELYNSLLEPVADRITASERLLILPDGPLHALPFAALVRATKDGPQTLAAWKPLHVALSATVYAELKQRRHPPSDKEADQAPLQLAAFGDPVYPQSFAALKNAAMDALPSGGTGRGDPTVRGAAERGLFDFQPLPYTRREVLGIASLFPEGTARTFLGPDAMEEKIKSLDLNTRILHLAAHGSTDEQLPSGSFIALTIPEETASNDASPQRDNGLLQVWEIFERVRLNADLVVLSACDSALGEELGGEGLIGLTRAFQYAGARTVLASLWSVNDLATSELMIRFYKHLRAGLPKDQALQAAQQELIQGPIEIVNEKGERESRDFSAPYFWAGFQLYGDWQ